MNIEWSKPSECIDLHRLMEAVVELRRQVASLEKAQKMQVLGGHSGLNLSVSLKTYANECRKRKAGLTRKAHQMPHIAPRVPRGRDS